MNLSDISIDECNIYGTHYRNSSVTDLDTTNSGIESEEASTSSSMQNTNSNSKPIKHRRPFKKIGNREKILVERHLKQKIMSMTFSKKFEALTFSW